LDRKAVEPPIGLLQRRDVAGCEVQQRHHKSGLAYQESFFHQRLSLPTMTLPLDYRPNSRKVDDEGDERGNSSFVSFNFLNENLAIESRPKLYCCRVAIDGAE
jgi:hypothetical protein